ncbi:hypothetical protein LY76DRAFT_395992 [Colletotrichum caudatum]|nr:hypothetical protein LY76DRAFT_395992 [Colletotrichum caudatum]
MFNLDRSGFWRFAARIVTLHRYGSGWMLRRRFRRGSRGNVRGECEKRRRKKSCACPAKPSQRPFFPLPIFFFGGRRRLCRQGESLMRTALRVCRSVDKEKPRDL